MAQTWSPSDYQQNAAFVPALGAPMLGLLAAQAGERILDLGCGDGVLTAQIVESGAEVVGVDASPEMVAVARGKGLDAHVVDAAALRFDSEFDAVFSNAVLHWIPDADAVLRGVSRALRPGGRFVAEFGGHLNVAAISTGIRAVFKARGLALAWPWYYPTPEAYGQKLVAAGFVVRSIALVPRPTPLPTDLDGWLRTFGGAIFSGLPETARDAVRNDIVELLRPVLCDASGNWTADYVRLRVVAVKSDQEAGVRS
jgi:SAM-dependent methyltransferase